MQKLIFQLQKSNKILSGQIEELRKKDKKSS